ncbi:Zinc finger CCCH domain-containing protein 42 [Capsicum annuum]|nr:Zinc finger CCCH domain-containing protein 42 [Capsicum annuum]
MKHPGMPDTKIQLMYLLASCLLTSLKVISVFSQYGEVVDVNLVRDKGTGKSKGFAFVAYEDQRSTNLTVHNLNGAQLYGRIIGVDYVSNYKKKEEEDEETERLKREERGVCRSFQRGECNRGAEEDQSSRWSHDKIEDSRKDRRSGQWSRPQRPD